MRKAKHGGKFKRDYKRVVGGIYRGILSLILKANYGR